MSTQTYLRASAIAALSTIAFAATAASANAQSSRYGNVYDYESGKNCGQACVPAAPMATTHSSRYGSTTTHSAPMPVAPGPVYVDCTQMGTCAPQAATVYTAPVQSYQAPAPTYTQSYAQTQSYNSAPVSCPAGTTAQSDGTCLQGSSYGGTTSTYTAPSSSYSSTTSSYGGTVDCPAGTTAQSDGTCMQTGSSSNSWSSSSTSSYGSSSSYASTTAAPVNCPAGTTAQSDGTCMQGGSSSYSNSTVEIYSGDAQTTQQPVYGYQSDGSYGSTDYLPIRK